MNPGCGVFYGTGAATGGSFTVQASFSGNLLRHPSNATGSVSADQVVRIDAGGDINEPIEQQDNDSIHPTLGAVVCQNLNAYISATRGRIAFVHATGSVATTGGVYAADSDDIGSVQIGGDMAGSIQ